MIDLLLQAGFFVTVATLPACDYIINDEIFIERKTARDFAVSIIDGRLFKQARMMKMKLKRSCFLIEGNPYQTQINISNNAIKGALISVQLMWYIPILYVSSMEETCQLFGMIANQQDEMIDLVELRHGYRPKKMISKKLYILQGLPNIGPHTAHKFIQHFGSVQKVMNASVDELIKAKLSDFWGRDVPES